MSENTADVIVIGSGIIGSSAAYYLAQKGHSVIVLEKSLNIADGGSTRNGGGVRQSGRDPRELPLAMYAVQNMWPTLSEELETDVEYYQQGNLRLGKTEEHLKILQGIVDRSKKFGLDLGMVNGNEAREICPYLSEEVIGSIWTPTDGHANPLKASLGYYRKARQMGVRFYTDQAVQEIQKIRGEARRVITQKGRFEGKKIILAAGLASRDIASTVGIDIPMSAILLETLVTEAQPPMFYQMLGTAAADFYGHQTTHGSFVFGGTSGFEAVAKHDGRPVTNSQVTSSTCRGILSYLPSLASAKVVRSWAGFIDICKDWVPVISNVEEVPGLVIAAGFTGHGFGIAPIAGKLVSELAAEEPTTLDVSAFRYDRFKTKI